MEAEEVVRIALEEAEKSLTTMQDRLSETCRGDQDLMFAAIKLVLKDKEPDAGFDAQRHLAIVLLQSAIKDRPSPSDPEMKAAAEIIRRPSDLNVSSTAKHERDVIRDLLAKTTEAIWNEPVTRAEVLLDGPNFQIVEIESADGTVRNAHYTWRPPKKQKQPS